MPLQPAVSRRQTAAEGPDLTTLSLRRLNKGFGTVEAIRPIDFDAANHKFVVLVGPSGCG
jgi:ABC-type Fe3+/spermidine/putrescine transport system ATPase subunit